MSKDKPLARGKDIVIQELGQEILIYDLRNNKAFNLNEPSALIWRFSNGENTISEIANKLSKAFNSNISEEFVWLALQQFSKDNLIENKDQISSFFENISRREVIRKVGFASLITLPIVSSLIVPTAAMAASLSCAATPFPLSCSCTANGNCSSACCGVNGSGAEVCVNIDDTPVGGACRGNCECAGASTCPSCLGLPRICRIGGCPP